MNDMETTNAAPKLTAIQTLRAVYVATRNGAPLDLAAYAELVLEAAADGCDEVAIIRAFEGLGYHTRLDILGAFDGAGARLRAVRDSRGWKAAIRVASLLSLTDVWACAMNAHFGPTGTHASRLGADGVPTLETLVEFPRIGEEMAKAAERFDGLCGWYDRIQAGKSYPIEQVVRYAAPRLTA
jgi:hypothetical protein